MKSKKITGRPTFIPQAVLEAQAVAVAKEKKKL
jgi:hypothetical protein